MAALGLDQFIPALLPFILEDAPLRYSTVIGPIGTPTVASESGWDGGVGLADIEDRTYVEVRLRFFPELNTPWYRVIVGAALDSPAAIERVAAAVAAAPPEGQGEKWRLHLTLNGQ